MAINIKNNWGPIIELRDNAKAYINQMDAIKRYEVIKRVLGDNIEDVDFENLPAEKLEELTKACKEASSVVVMDETKNGNAGKKRGKKKQEGGR